jgi:predicted metalloendopeptidase
MRHSKLFFAIPVFAAVAVFAQTVPSTPAVEHPRSLDLSALDRNVDPCEDFYEYACGTWRKTHPVPPDQGFWARYNQVAEYNREVLRGILENAAKPAPERTHLTSTIGDFYYSCMDEASANQKGAGSLKPQLARIAKIHTRGQLMDVLAALHAEGLQAAFALDARPDLHDARVGMAEVVQGGLGLPDRDYYVNQDDKSKAARTQYRAHVAKMLVLAGDDPAAAEREASVVLDIETRLAEASLDRVAMRDPKNQDHKMPVSEFSKLAPNLKFARFAHAAGAPAFTEINVAPPDFFQKLNGMLDSVALDDWKTYLKWHVVRADAPFLSDAFVQEDFDFDHRYLSGQKEIQARWKRCVQTSDNLLGQALGRVYVEQVFSPAGKERMMKMVRALEDSLAEDIEGLSWMTPDTKSHALAKLHAITNKIGYPEKWRDYGGLKLGRDDLLGNIHKAEAFNTRYTLGKIGQTLDKTEWFVTTPTVNAYYAWSENSINFPAGVLQPPFFDANMDDSVNFGAIGWLIGHELTHGFDDQGSKFDGDGNLKNWWTAGDRKEFDGRTGCVANQYQQFVAIDDLHVNGKLTLGENTADNGGIRIALMALHKLAGEDQADKKIDGFTRDQRFFISFAQQWCANVTPERLRLTLKVDPHSPVRYRTLGTLGNDPDFAKAFSCKAGQKMVSANPCRVW